MRKLLAAALLFMVVLSSYSQPFLSQNLAKGLASKQVRWGFLLTYHNRRSDKNGYGACNASVSSINTRTGNHWSFSEKQSFMYCSQELTGNFTNQVIEINYSEP